MDPASLGIEFPPPPSAFHPVNSSPSGSQIPLEIRFPVTAVNCALLNSETVTTPSTAATATTPAAPTTPAAGNSSRDVDGNNSEEKGKGKGKGKEKEEQKEDDEEEEEEEEEEEGDDEDDSLSHPVFKMMSREIGKNFTKKKKEKKRERDDDDSDEDQWNESSDEKIEEEEEGSDDDTMPLGWDLTSEAVLAKLEKKNRY